jgi:hypothetical protein
MARDFIDGVLKGSSFGGNSQCNAAMIGVVEYGFEVINNR